MRFVNDKAGYFPLLFYLAWVPYILSLGSVPVEGLFAHGLAGVPVVPWALSSSSTSAVLLSFIVTATFWVLVAPNSAVVGALLGQPSELRRWRAPSPAREKAGGERSQVGGRRLRRAAAEAAAFPSTLAESLGQALVPGGWIHRGHRRDRGRGELPGVAAAAAGGEARRATPGRVGRSRGGARRVLGLAEFPAIPAAATAPYARELAPTLARSRSSSWARRCSRGTKCRTSRRSRGKTAAD